MNELERIKIIQAVVEHRLTGVQACERLHLSERQITRLRRRFEAHGPIGLISGKRDRPSNRELSPDIHGRAMALVRERYADFGPTLACEKLRESHGVLLSKDTVRRWMCDAGLWIPRKLRAPKIYQPRNRRACLGELIQIDGCDHYWFEDRAPSCVLLVFIDDATSHLMTLHFTETESTFSYFEAMAKYVSAHGKPVALYSDKFSVFYVKDRSSTAGKGVTQFGRALYELNIDTICANTSQAKGRVERANLTLQDRLVKELRLRDISTRKAANAYAPSFIADFNQRFGKPPKSQYNAHRPLREDEDLARIFVWRETRTVSQSLTVQYDRVLYLIKDVPENRHLIHKRVDVLEFGDGRISIEYEEEPLLYTEYDRLADIDQGAIVENKRLGRVLAVAQAMQALRDNRRASGSPSRTHRGAEVRAKTTPLGLKKQRAMTRDDFDAAVQKTIEEQGAALPPHPKGKKKSE